MHGNGGVSMALQELGSRTRPMIPAAGGLCWIWDDIGHRTWDAGIAASRLK